MGFSLANAVFGSELIQSVDVAPNPLVTGRTFTISVNASPDVTQATASVDFRPGAPRSLSIELTKQGDVWTGSGTTPSDILREIPANVGATVRVTLSDAAGRTDQRSLRLGVRVETITAVFADGILTITGDDLDNNINVIRDAAGKLFVNGGVIPVTGGTATVNNTSLIRILGRQGNDLLTISEINGTLPRTNILGEEGNDAIISGSGSDELDGGPGDDTIFGKGGEDRIFGGTGNDFLSGGTGLNDDLFGGEGDDVIDWRPGEGSDVAEGQEGNDTMQFLGSNGSEIVDISANGPRLLFSRNPGVVTMDCDGIERVSFKAVGGADQVNIRDLTNTQVRDVAIDLFNSDGVDDAAADLVEVDGTAASDTITATGSTNEVRIARLNSVVTVSGADQTLDKIVINALGGDDTVDASAVQAGVNDMTLNGGAGIDTLTGGKGNDQLIGAAGNDTVFGGEGDDTFIWNPGDANDIFEGQAGQDTMLFNGANVAEVIVMSADGPRLHFTRNIATVVMDCDDIEVVQFTAKGNSDSITINDLSDTDVREVKLDLSANADGGSGDSSVDLVHVSGTSVNDVAAVNTSGGAVNIVGLAAKVSIFGSEDADAVVISTFGGDDVINASGLPAGLIRFVADGGDDDDVITGSAGNDALFGGEGDDVLIGGPGIDVIDGGPGANVIIQD